ncbi:MAG: NAD-dependent epimerase/dehydratase family protein [Candidatus Odinarchaeota archaeon]
MSKVLVTGGAGYIGQVMCRGLSDAGFKVKIIDNLLYGIPPESDFEFIKGDISNVDDVNKAMKGVDHIIHLAAIANDPATDLDPILSLVANYEAIKLLKNVAMKYKVERFLFSSSCSVYGGSGGEITHENSPTSPITLYGRLKVDAERDLLQTKEDFNPILFRNATAFGYSRRMRFDLAINILTIMGLMIKKYTVFGGDQWRPFVHIKDITKAFILGLEKPLDTVSRQIFNVGSNELNFQMKQIHAILKKELPEANGIIDDEKEDKRSYHVDFSKIEQELGFKASQSILDGIREIKEAVKNGEFADWKTNTQYYCVKHLKMHGKEIFPQLQMGKTYPDD